jgi:hypothetical protein
VRTADNLTTFMCRLSKYLGAATSWNTTGLSRPVMGLLLFLWRNSRNRTLASSFGVSRSHTIRHMSMRAHCRTPLNERSARRTGRYIHSTQQIQETNIHALSGIRTRDPSNRGAADLRFNLLKHSSNFIYDQV